MNPDAPAGRQGRLLLATIAALLVCLSAAAQSDAKKRFLDGLQAPLATTRVAAVEALVATTLPQAMEWMRQALDRTWKSRAQLLERDEKLAAEIDEPTSGGTRLDPKARKAKLDALKKEQTELRVALDRDEQVILALQSGMGRLFAAQPEAHRKKTIAPLLRHLKRARKLEEQSALAATLGYFEGSLARDALVRLLKAKDPRVRIAALDALGRQRDAAAVVAVARCFGDAFWQVRAATVQALDRIGGRAAVEILIDGLGKSEHRIADDIVAALVRLTGQNFHDNRALWRKWWSANKGRYEAPPVAAKNDGAQPAPSGGWKNRTGGTAFYGIHTRSKRLVYILDISGSMLAKLGPTSATQTGSTTGAIGERKLDQAINELTTSVDALSEDATFNIIFYHHAISVWAEAQVKATAENKQRAIEWTESMAAAGATNIFDALERGFRLAGRGTFDKRYGIAADTFYLLSDGQANRGRFTKGDEMRREVARLNKFRKVVIHTVALGAGADAEFMQGLAHDTGGQFVHFGARGKR